MEKSEWLEIYYQITSEGRKHAGWKKRFTDPIRSSYVSDVLDYLAKYPNTPRSLQQIYKGTSWDITKRGVLNSVETLKRKGWIKKIK